MNDDNDKTALREQCGACGGPIEEGEDREEVVEYGEIIARIHINCA